MDNTDMNNSSDPITLICSKNHLRGSTPVQKIGKTKKLLKSLRNLIIYGRFTHLSIDRQLD